VKLTVSAAAAAAAAAGSVNGRILRLVAPLR